MLRPQRNIMAFSAHDALAQGKPPRVDPEFTGAVPRLEKREIAPASIDDVMCACKTVEHEHFVEWIRLSDGMRIGMEHY